MKMDDVINILTLGLSQEYTNHVVSRFIGREQLSKENFYLRYWQDAQLNQQEVYDLCDLIEEVYGVSAGLLRPQDDINKLTDPAKTKKWWRNIFHESSAGDNEFWLQQELEKKLKKYGTTKLFKKIDTVDDLFQCWCGQLPKAKLE